MTVPYRRGAPPAPEPRKKVLPFVPPREWEFTPGAAATLIAARGRSHFFVDLWFGVVYVDCERRAQPKLEGSFKAFPDEVAITPSEIVRKAVSRRYTIYIFANGVLFVFPVSTKLSPESRACLVALVRQYRRVRTPSAYDWQDRRDF